ncbi:hypothetical protein D915_003658 [Fasciola hepatica]|uniref:Uncharacterized protein n=1 Tax=Fasciola hepatica TaxID=6192 RepID=A0A4E0S1Z0_FASHE|nr:hypothetical protein D915_003658 [Fasciola hepatica]
MAAILKFYLQAYSISPLDKDLEALIFLSKKPNILDIGKIAKCAHIFISSKCEMKRNILTSFGVPVDNEDDGQASDELEIPGEEDEDLQPERTSSDSSNSDDEANTLRTEANNSVQTLDRSSEGESSKTDGDIESGSREKLPLAKAT